MTAALLRSFKNNKWKIKIKMPNNQWAEFLYSNEDVAQRHFNEFCVKQELAGLSISNIQLIEIEIQKG